jgi:hypothetical protein
MNLLSFDKSSTPTQISWFLKSILNYKLGINP